MLAEETEKKFKALWGDFTRYQRKIKSLPSGSGRYIAAQVDKYECFQWQKSVFSSWPVPRSQKCHQ